MQSEKSNNEVAFDLLQSKEFLTNISTLLMPALRTAVNEAVQRAVVISNSPTMSKEDFAAANGISKSVLEKWIANGVVLLAPTPTSTVMRITECKKTGEKRTNVMEKHGNALINVAAWREKNRQHALKCRYIKP